MTEAENAEVDKLAGEHGGLVGLTRRDPGDTGPVIVTVMDGTEIVLDYLGEADG